MDRVYQFNGGRSSITSSVLFSLAAGNTNPQGIADPPVPCGFLPRNLNRFFGLPNIAPFNSQPFFWSTILVAKYPNGFANRC